VSCSTHSSEDGDLAHASIGVGRRRFLCCRGVEFVEVALVENNLDGRGTAEIILLVPPTLTLV